MGSALRQLESSSLHVVLLTLVPWLVVMYSLWLVIGHRLPWLVILLLRQPGLAILLDGFDAKRQWWMLLSMSMVHPVLMVALLLHLHALGCQQRHLLVILIVLIFVLKLPLARHVPRGPALSWRGATEYQQRDKQAQQTDEG